MNAKQDMGIRRHEVLFISFKKLPLRVQVLNNHILTQNLYYKYYLLLPKS